MDDEIDEYDVEEDEMLDYYEEQDGDDFIEFHPIDPTLSHYYRFFNSFGIPFARIDSVPIPHHQFIDIFTGNATMTFDDYFFLGDFDASTAFGDELISYPAWSEILDEEDTFNACVSLHISNVISQQGLLSFAGQAYPVKAFYNYAGLLNIGNVPPYTGGFTDYIYDALASSAFEEVYGPYFLRDLRGFLFIRHFVSSHSAASSIGYRPHVNSNTKKYKARRSHFLLLSDRDEYIEYIDEARVAERRPTGYTMFSHYAAELMIEFSLDDLSLYLPSNNTRFENDYTTPHRSTYHFFKNPEPLSLWDPHYLITIQQMRYFTIKYLIDLADLEKYIKETHGTIAVTK